MLLVAALTVVGVPTPGPALTGSGRAIEFRGTGSGGVDRIRIRVADPSTRADVAWSFTLEWWIRARRSENALGEPTCGAEVYGWITGHTIADRDRWPLAGPDGRDFGVSVGRSGRIAFGLATDRGVHTVCTTGVNVLDDRWHHVAVQRRVRELEIWVDGHRRAAAEGPPGTVRYPTTGVVPRPADPFLVLGAEKHDAGPSYPSFAGRIDELRLSDVARYRDPFTPRRRPFAPDDRTVLLFHFNRGATGPCTTGVRDAAGVRNGTCIHGGRGGPRFVDDSPVAS